MVVLDILHLYRAECAESHMEGHVGNLYSHSLNLSQKLLGKMQARRRRRRRPFMPGIDGLVTVLVLQLVCNIRRQWHLAQLVQDLLKNTRVMELNQAVPVIHSIHHGSCKQALTEFNDSSRLCLLSRAHQGLPYIILSSFQQQYLYFRPGVLLHPEEPGRYDLCIVNHQAVPWP